MPPGSLGYEFLKLGISGAIGATLTIHFIQLGYLPDICKPSEHVEAAQPDPNYPGVPRPPSPLEAKPVQSVGLPHSSHLRVFDGYVCAYDRRNRIPLWVLEHLTSKNLGRFSNTHENQPAPVNRAQFDFYEDQGELEMFRASNKDYVNSGFDRGHMAAAGNHRFDHTAMEQTFILSNIAPQVGVGFNRHAWNDLEKYIRSIARRSENVVVITGPLFLPRFDGGKKRVCYEVIGPNNVAVPTHFFKAVAIQEQPGGPWRSVAWVLPNEKLPEKVDLKAFQVPLNAVERSSGLKLFPNLSNG